MASQMMTGYGRVLLQQAQRYPLAAGGLLLSLAVLIYFVFASFGQFGTPEKRQALNLALRGGTAGALATAAGSLPAILLQRISQRTADSLLGFGAGMMLAASSFSLILPGIDAARTITGNGTLGALVVVAGLALGVMLMLGLDRFMPHEHSMMGMHGPEAARLGRIWLFVIAIALHNFPEGMAIGVSFAPGELSAGLTVTTAIAIQDMPEGLAVAMALRAIALSPAKAAWIGAATGLMEPLGALVGVSFASGMALFYPIGMGMSAGAMIFVVSHEVIPETHRNGHQTPATIGLMAGFAVMMFLDTALA
jgi:ZIP family zinc transporter